MYWFGFGVSQDYVQAHMWINLAAARGSELAVKKREIMTEQMTSAQIAEAQKLARAWKPKKEDQTSTEPQPATPPATIRATGTGFAVDPDGLVLTAHHVVAGGREIKVCLADGRTAQAHVVKSLRAVDLVLMKLDVPTPNFLEIADHGSLRTGQRVFTMGFPAVQLLGGEPKFTEGNISSLTGVGDDATFLQISVPIQPGNSGGPIVNEEGKVVGIIAATASVETFFGATGQLPQNVNWAVNSDFAQTLIGVQKGSPATKTRQEAIDLVRKSICFVMSMD